MQFHIPILIFVFAVMLTYRRQRLRYVKISFSVSQAIKREDKSKDRGRHYQTDTVYRVSKNISNYRIGEHFMGADVSTKNIVIVQNFNISNSFHRSSESQKQQNFLKHLFTFYSHRLIRHQVLWFYTLYK